MAQGGVQQFTFLSPNNGYTTGAVVVNVSFQGVGEAVWAGRYDATVNSVAEKIFCTDFRHNIGPYTESYTTLAKLGDITRPFDTTQSLQHLPGDSDGSNDTYYYQDASGNGSGMVAAMTQTGSGFLDYAPIINTGTLSLQARANQVAWLTDTYLNSALLTATQLGGVQLAIWDIIQDGGDGFAAGNLQASNSQAAVVDAGTYLTQAGSHSNYQPSSAFWIQAPRYAVDDPDHEQDFVMHDSSSHITGGPVPEPAFYQLTALLGLGVLGMFRMRRTAQSNIAA